MKWLPCKILLFLVGCAFAWLAQAADVIVGPTFKNLVSSEMQQALIEKGKVDFESKISALQSAGVLIDRAGLEYLAAELFYNVPNRKIVITDIKQIEILTLEVIAPHTQSYLIQNIFPELLNLPIERLGSLNAILLTGNGQTFFVWDNKTGIYFILKQDKSENPQITDGMTKALLPQIKERKDSSIDFVPEIQLNFSSKSNEELDIFRVRPLRTMRMALGLAPINEVILPLHGFLGSFYVHELAQKSGLTTFEYIENVFVPLLANYFFESIFDLGLIFHSHTQNLWVVVSPNGKIRLAAKDLMDVTKVPLFGDESSIRMHDRLAHSNDGYEAFVHETTDNPRGAADPAFNFASYGIQSILSNGPWNSKQQCRLLIRFFNEVVQRLEERLQFKFKWSQKLEMHLSRLKDFSHEFDLRIDKVYTRRIVFETIGRLNALSYFIWSEIFEQVQSKTIGEHLIAKNRIEEKILLAKFKNEGKNFQLTTEVSPPRFLKTPFTGTGNLIKNALYTLVNAPLFMIGNLFYNIGSHPRLKRGKLAEAENHVVFLDPKLNKVMAVARIPGGPSCRFVFRTQTLQH